MAHRVSFRSDDIPLGEQTVASVSSFWQYLICPPCQQFSTLIFSCLNAAKVITPFKQLKGVSRGILEQFNHCFSSTVYIYIFMHIVSINFIPKWSNTCRYSFNRIIILWRLFFSQFKGGNCVSNSSFNE